MRQHGEFVTILTAKTKLRKGSQKQMKNRINSSKRIALYLAQGGLIAAMYVLLTMLVNAVGLASQPIQLRLSEALCILPVFTPAAIPGLFIGCLLANLISGCMWQDVLFGSLATLVGAVVTYLIGKIAMQHPHMCAWVAGVPAVVANTLVVPPVLKLVYGISDSIWYLYLTVCAGEILSAWLLGGLLFLALYKRKDKIFRT
jgi:uncharacterized membrane protein